MIYEGTVEEINYRHGFDNGYEIGEFHAKEFPNLVHDQIVYNRDYAEHCALRSERAYTLGWLRGYRQAVDP